MKKKTTITNWVSFLLKQIINRIKSRTKLNYWKTSGNDKLPIQKWKKKKKGIHIKQSHPLVEILEQLVHKKKLCL